jgi:stage III sporulation protein SpoIIIAA
MHFQIDYLVESTEEEAVLFSERSEAVNVDAAVREAGHRLVSVQGPIDGFQIRDMEKRGAIVHLRHLFL